MARRSAALLAVVVVASACGGSEEPTASTASPASTPEPERLPPVVDAIDDLTDFTCQPGEGDGWVASGVLTNSTQRVASYAVTVVVAGSEPGRVPGKRRTLPVPPGEPTQFAIRAIPVAAGLDPACSVRVVRHR